MNQTPLSTVSLPAEVFRRGPLTTAAGERLTTDDKLEMIEAVRLFEWAFISRNLPALLDLLTEDVVIDHALGYLEGKQNLAEGRGPEIPFYGLRHSYLNQVVYIDSAGAPAVLSCMNVVQVSSEKAVQVSLPAIYVNNITVHTFRREEGAWKMCRLVFDQLKMADYLKIDPREAASNSLTADQRGKGQEH